MKTDNELIAEFMKFYVTSERTLVDATIERVWKANEYPYFGGFRTKQLSQFETSWDWLMPVVEKIGKVKGVHFVVSELGCDIYSFGKKVYCSRESTKISTVYKAVCEFIKWHNEVKPLTK